MTSPSQNPEQLPAGETAETAEAAAKYPALMAAADIEGADAAARQIGNTTLEEASKRLAAPNATVA